MKINFAVWCSLLFCTQLVAAQEIITRISTTAEGSETNNHSFAPSISGNGRYVVFQSDATNLVADDTNGFTDIFLYDRYTQQIKCISRNIEGKSANFKSNFPIISHDGHYVVFQSDASDLVANDTNQVRDIFIYDVTQETIKLISIDSQGIQGDGPSSFPVISTDGHYIAFHSDATNLVADDTKTYTDIFLHDRITDKTTRISVSSKGTQANNSSYGATISGDGRYIAYASDARNLVTKDTNGKADVFIYDRENATTQRISVDETGVEANNASHEPALSLDGQWLAFVSWATNLVPDDNDTNQVEDVFLRNLTTGKTTRISINEQNQEGNNASFAPRISGNNRYIVFNSEANNLTTNDENNTIDVFLYDRDTQHITNMTPFSQTFSNSSASYYPPAISDDGRFVAYESRALNLVASDLNESADIFVYDRDYCPIYEQTIQIGYIPVLHIVQDGFYRAHLILNPDNLPEQDFALETYNKVRIPLENVTNSFDPSTGILSLPCVEIFDYDGVLARKMAVELKNTESEPMTFRLINQEVTQIFEP